MTDRGDTVSDTRTRALEEIRAQYPPLLTSAHVAELMHCTIGEVRDQVHRGALPAVRWGNQFRFFRDEVLAVLLNRPPGPADEETD
jgi:excisionase family DNA binding protein